MGRPGYNPNFPIENDPYQYPPGMPEPSSSKIQDKEQIQETESVSDIPFDTDLDSDTDTLFPESVHGDNNNKTFDLMSADLEQLSNDDTGSTVSMILGSGSEDPDYETESDTKSDSYSEDSYSVSDSSSNKSDSKPKFTTVSIPSNGTCFFYAIAYFLNNEDYIKNKNKSDVICGYALRVRGFLYQKYKSELENTPHNDIASNDYWEDIGISKAVSLKNKYPLFSRTNSGITDINYIISLSNWVGQLKPTLPPECKTDIYADMFDFNAMGIFLKDYFNIDLIIKQNDKYYHINSHNLYKFNSTPTAMTDHELKKQYNNKQSIFITHAGDHFDVLQKQNGLLPNVNEIPSTYFALYLPNELKRLIRDYTSTKTDDSRLVHEFISLLIESAIKGLYNKKDMKRLFKTNQNGEITGLNEASKSTIEKWEIMPNEKKSTSKSFFNAINNILTNMSKIDGDPLEKNKSLTEEEYRKKIHNYLNEQNEVSSKNPTNITPSILAETKIKYPELSALDDATILNNILNPEMDIDHELALVCIEEIYKMKFILLQTPPIKDKEFTINTRVKFTLSDEKETTYGTIQSIEPNNQYTILLDNYKLIENVDKSRLKMSNRYVIATGSGVRMKQKKKIKCCAFILCSSDKKPIYNALRYKLTTFIRETTTHFKYVWEIDNLPSYLNYMIFMVAYGFKDNGRNFGSLKKTRSYTIDTCV